MGTIFTFFRRVGAAVAAMLLLSQTAQAQVSAYTFSQLSGTYTPITGGTVLGSTTSDDQHFVTTATPLGGTVRTGIGLPIGFNFTFNGQVFDRFAVSTNGWISLGQSALTPSVNTVANDYTFISSTATTTPPQLANRIGALSADLQSQTGGELRYETIGTAPNRTLVVQWTNYRRFNQTGQNLNFQIRLNETSNIVEVVYGTFTTNATANTAQVGLRGQTNADFNNRSVVNGTNTWATSAPGANNAATCAFVGAFVPTSGQTYRWTPATCLPPTGFANSNVQPTTVDFAWTTNLTNGQMVIVAQGAAPTTGTPFTITGTTFTATGLTPATPYSAYIRQICAVGDTSNWTAASNFTTACLPITPPWTESFEGVAVTATGGPLPVCWNRNTVDFATGNNAQSNNRSARTGTKYLYTAWSSVATVGDWAFTPGFALTAGTSYDFSFWYKNDGLTGWDSMKVAIGTAQLPGNMIYVGSTIYNITNTSFQEYRVTVPVGATGVYYFGVNVYVNGTPWYITFDDFNVEVSPSCPQPSGIAFSAITNNSATVNWTGLGAGNNYLYHFGASPLASPATVVGTPVTGTTQNFTGLTGNTAYQFYVRQICAVGDTSQWSGPFSFTTTCDPNTPGDTRATAINVNTLTYNTTGNTNSPCYTNTIGSTSKDVWYRVILHPCASTISASLCTGTSYDSYLRIYAADGTTQLAFNDDGCGVQSVINGLNIAGRDTVYVLVEGFGSSVGAYGLQITQTVPVTLTADVSYSNALQCVAPNSANILPTINGSTGGVFTAGAGLAIDSVSGEINLVGSTPNNYNVVYTVSDLTVSPTCLARDTFAVNVVAQDNASFSYAATTFCNAGTNPAATITGSAGGSFTASSASLVVDGSTGVIDLAASQVGAYDVTYSTTGTCPASLTRSVTVEAPQNPAFNYSAPTYCQNVANPAATITGTTGGAFSAPTGLVINPNTGLINLTASAVGAYTVTYTTPNSCAAAQSQSVEILAADDASFSFSANTFCQNRPSPQAIVTGVPNGTFSSGTGLPVDIQFGIVDLSSAITGTPHTVIYATNGTCPNFSVQTLTVLPADNADISYSAATICLTTLPSNETPTITGNSTGGTFSATGGLNINANTGAISTAFGANQEGTYTITYATTGPTTCPDTATFTLTLEDCTTVGVVDFATNEVRQNAYNLYPNPAITEVNLHNKGAYRIANIELVDLLGRSLHTWAEVVLQEDAATTLQLPSMPSATYYLRIVAPNEAPVVMPLRIQQP